MPHSSGGWRMCCTCTPNPTNRGNQCFDERPCQLVGDVLEPLPRKPGRAKRVDYEYERHGVCNAFMLFQPLAGWREVKVTEQRTKRDFAYIMRLSSMYIFRTLKPSGWSWITSTRIVQPPYMKSFHQKKRGAW